MGSRHTDRLWIIAGAAAIVLLAIATWFLAVSPQRAGAAELETRTQETHAQADDLHNRIVKLTAEKAKLPALTQALRARQAALPPDSGVPAFLRQLQATGTKVGVNVSGITVGDPAPEPTAGVWALPIQLTAEGTEAHLGSFLEQLQSAEQKRAVLVKLANLTTKTDTAGVASLSLTLRAFVAPPVGAGAPSITTD